MNPPDHTSPECGHTGHLLINAADHSIEVQLDTTIALPEQIHAVRTALEALALVLVDLQQIDRARIAATN